MTHEEQAGPSPKKLRSNASGTETPSNSDADMENVQVKECCIICEGSTEDDLRKSHDKDRMGISMRDCAIKTKNKALEYRLPINNDLVAADVYYHLSCWTTLKNAARAVDRLSSTSKSAPFDPIAIAQLVVMISSNEKEIYKLSSLKAMYETILSNSCQPSKFIITHSTRFKNHLLEHLPGWQCYNDGRDVILSHDGTVGAVLAEKLNEQVNDEEAMKLMQTALLIRKHILAAKQAPFDGSFPTQGLTAPVPQPVLSFFSVVMNGPKVSTACDSETSDKDLYHRVKIAAGP